MSPRGITWTLLLIGVGLTLGNLIGGRLADWNLATALAGMAGTHLMEQTLLQTLYISAYVLTVLMLSIGAVLMATDRLVTAGIDKHVRGWEKPSDHVPVWCEIRA